MKGFLRFIGTTLLTLLRVGVWPVVAGLVFVFSLTLVALTFSGPAALGDGADPGRMARSFVVYLVLAAVMLGVPAVLANARTEIGQQSFLRTFGVALSVGLSFIIVAIPSIIVSAILGGVDFGQWIPIVALTKLETWVIAALTALAFSNVRRDGAAAITAFGLVAGLAIAPLFVVASASFGPTVTQTVRTLYLDYGNGNQVIDPVTGFPMHPTCSPGGNQIKTVTRYDAVWPALELNPFVLVSGASTPAFSTVDNVDDPYAATSVEPVDVFGTVDLAVRRMQLPIETDVTIDECANLAQYGTPYPSGYDGTYAPQYVVDHTTSGLGVGLIGQGAYLAVASAALVLIGRRSRR
ncbi:MAG: hypothetical protein RLZZ319_92 [Actinomycetota bacterium]